MLINEDKVRAIKDREMCLEYMEMFLKDYERTKNRDFYAIALGFGDISRQLSEKLKTGFYEKKPWVSKKLFKETA